MMAILTTVKWYLIVAFICISLMASDAEHPFICLWALCMSSLEKYRSGALPMRMQTGVATVENNMEFPQKKLKMQLPFDPVILLLGLYPKNPKSPIQKNLYTQKAMSNL